MDLAAATLTIPLVNGLPQLEVAGVSISEVSAEQMTAPGGLAGDRQMVGFDSGVVFQGNSGHHQMNVAIEAQIALA